MIRQATAWIVTLTFVAGLAVPVFAQGTQAAPAQAPATSAPAAPAAPAAKAPAPAPKKVAAKSAAGTVKSATADSLMLVTVGKDKKEKEWAFVLDKDTKIMKDGKAAEAKDLAKKDAATVTFTEAADKMLAKSVTVKKKPS